jgi:uncharacterized heparinase superfamily protein
VASATARKSVRKIRRDVVERVQRAWGESPFYQARLNGPAPDRLALKPNDPYTPDRTLAEAVAAGRLAIGAHRIECEGEIERLWTLAGETGPLHDFLHRFVWLRHLAALGARGREPALRLAQAWFDAHEKWSPVSWSPHATGERLVNLCCHGQAVLARGDAPWRSRVLTSMARQTRHLARASSRAAAAHERLLTAMALTVAALALPGCEPEAEKGLELLRRELRLQIRPDGGHVSRNPSRQLELVVRLQMVLQALEARRMPAPGFLRHVMSRAAAHVQLFRSGDGRLAVFNGGCEDDGAALAAAIAAIDEAAEPMGFARHSGFQRLEGGRSVLIADVGAARGVALAPGGHQGCASFHFSSGRSRLVVNCGSGAHLPGDWPVALRQAAAHSTLSTEPRDVAAALFRDSTIIHRRAEDPRGHLLEIERAWGSAGESRHVRRFYLAGRGDDLRGEDRLVGASADLLSAWRIRFHLHPSVKASIARDGRTVLLALANKEGWRFRSNCRELALERSVYCGEGGLPQSTEQIVLKGRLGEAGAAGDMVVRWSIRRMDAALAPAP